VDTIAVGKVEWLKPADQLFTSSTLPSGPAPPVQAVPFIQHIAPGELFSLLPFAYHSKVRAVNRSRQLEKYPDPVSHGLSMAGSEQVAGFRLECMAGFFVGISTARLLEVMVAREEPQHEVLRALRMFWSFMKSWANAAGLLWLGCDWRFPFARRSHSHMVDSLPFSRTPRRRSSSLCASLFQVSDIEDGS